MACDTSYLLEDILTTCGSKIRTILLNPTSLITSPIMTANTYSIYESRAEYDASDEYDANGVRIFKGILVWHTHKYYASLIDDDGSDSEYRADAGFYVVPTFGDMIIRPNVEVKQLLTVIFDSNADLDYDPFGLKITNVINTFVNNVNKSLEKYDDELEVNDRKLFVSVRSISKSKEVVRTVFERRAVTIELRYCHCY